MTTHYEWNDRETNFYKYNHKNYHKHRGKRTGRGLNTTATGTVQCVRSFAGCCMIFRMTNKKKTIERKKEAENQILPQAVHNSSRLKFKLCK